MKGRRFEIDEEAYDPKQEHFLGAAQGFCIRPDSTERKNCMNGGTLKRRLYVDEMSHWKFTRTFVSQAPWFDRWLRDGYVQDL